MQWVVILALSAAAFDAGAGPATGFSAGVTLPKANRDKQSRASTQKHAYPKSGGQPDPAGVGPWWQHTAPDTALHIRYVGAYDQAPGGQPAIALLANQAFARTRGFNSQIAVYDAGGRHRVQSDWRRSQSDPRLLYCVVPQPGHYTVRVRAGLRDQAGHTLNKSVSGPVRVEPPAAAGLLPEQSLDQ